MKDQEMQRFIADITTTWPRIEEQWRAPVYAQRLQGYLLRVTWAQASAGLFRWVDEHNRPPTIEGLIEKIDAAIHEERLTAAREATGLPTPDQVASHSPSHRSAEDKVIATEALAMIQGFLDKRLTMANCVARCQRLAAEASTPDLADYWARYAGILRGETA